MSCLMRVHPNPELVSHPSRDQRPKTYKGSPCDRQGARLSNYDYIYIYIYTLTLKGHSHRDWYGPTAHAGNNANSVNVYIYIYAHGT